MTARAPRPRAAGAAPARPYAVAGVAPGSVFGIDGLVAVEVALDPEPAAVEVIPEPGPAVEVLPGSPFVRVVRPAAVDEAA